MMIQLSVIDVSLVSVVGTWFKDRNDNDKIVLMMLMHVSCARNSPSEDYNRTVRKLKYTLIISILFLGYKGSSSDHQHLFGITKWET